MLFIKTLLSAMISGLVCSANAGVTDASTAARAIEAAQTAQRAAARVNGEWRDIGKMIKAAKQAAADGNFDKAVSLAHGAEAQARLGKTQALEQADAGNPAYLYD